MTYSADSVIQFSPAAGTVTFTIPETGEAWVEPLIGFAIVVTHVDEETGAMDTTLSPVVLNESARAIPVWDYRDHGFGLRWAIRLGGAG